MIRVALAQYQPAGSVEANLDLVRQFIERAGQEGTDLICFSHDFLGFDGPAAPVIDRLCALAKEHHVEILAGAAAMADGSPAQASLIGCDGEVIDQVPAGVVRPLRTCLGNALVLTEEQAYSEETDVSARQFRPKVMVMQTNAISLLELEAIKELAIDRSYNQAHLVMCVSVVGQCRDESCLGVSLAVLQGEILVEADSADGELALFSVDPTKFLDYDELRDPVTIPALLRQKYGPRDLGHISSE